MKTLRHVRNFTLIELLIVIAIIGVIGALLLPTFGNMEESAKLSASDYNAAGIRRYLETYFSQNGAYPSALHNGLCNDGTDFVKKVDVEGEETSDYAMPPLLLNNMKYGTRLLGSDEDENGKFRQSLYAAGIKKVMTGFKGHSGYTDADPDRYNSVIREAPLRCINDDWFSAFSETYDENWVKVITGVESGVLAVKGKRLKNWVKDMYSDPPGVKDAEWCRLVPVFVTETALMASGTDLKNNNRIGLASAPVSPYAKKGEFAYYVVVFYAFANGNPAYIYTIISPEGTCMDSTAY